MRLFIVCVCLLMAGSMFAQQQTYVPPSPNAAAMARFANIEVGHYSGVPNIAIPFGELPGKEVTIPVSLQYHASGIKVQDVAGSAGLGWNLNAGGAITRMVQGLPDGLKNMCPTGAPTGTNQNRFYNNVNEYCDGERDVYYFSFLGRTGKLFLDDSNEPRTMPYQDLEIHKLSGSPEAYWSITDEAGYTYYFGENAAQQEQTIYYTSTGATYLDKYTFVSTWYLNRIISPSGIQVATFTYSAGGAVEYIMYSQQKIGSPNPVDYNTKIKIKEPKYISNIATALGSVTFSYVTTRTDLTNGWYLTNVNFLDQAGFIQKKFHLLLDYFLCNDQAPSPCRLRLSSINEGRINPKELYTFVYNETSDNPTRESYYEDFYGYYNFGRLNCTGPDFRVSNTCSPGNGACKQPWESGKVFSLAEIHNNSGGKTVFDYTLEEGLRINFIANYDGSLLCSKSTFSYSGVQTLVSPEYSYTTHDDLTVCGSSSYRELYDLNGVNGGYPTVTESFLDGSKVVYDFLSHSDYGDSPPTVIKYKHDYGHNPENKGAQDVNGPPFAPSTSKAWMRGLPKLISTYDSENNLLKTESMTYQEGSVVGSFLNTIVQTYKQPSQFTYTFLVGEYLFESRPVYLLETTQTIYGQDGYSSAQLLQDKSTYTYHSIHKTFPVSVIRQVGSGPQEKMTFRYPIDVAGIGTTPPVLADTRADAIWNMISRHFITPIEEVRLFKNIGEANFKIIGAELKTFKRNVTYATPMIYENYSLAIADPVTSLSPQATLTSGGTVFSFDNRYIKRGEYTYNESTATILSGVGSDGLIKNYEYLNNSMVSAVILNPGSTQMRKDYMYNSILGLTQSTDVNGRNSKVEYESNLGRVKLLRDHDDNIVKRYRYHIEGETLTVPTAAVSKSAGCFMINTSITFSGAISSEYGVTTYEWDFGDGVTSTSTRGSASHTYLTQGSFTIKVKRTNPEYLGASESSLSIVIGGPITSATVCTNGVVAYDKCHILPNTLGECDLGGPVERRSDRIKLSNPIKKTIGNGGTSNVGAGGIALPYLVVSPNNIVSQYAWQYSVNGGSWNSFGYSSSSIQGPPSYDDGVPSDYAVRCVLTDNCGNSFISTVLSLSCYASQTCN